MAAVTVAAVAAVTVAAVTVAAVTVVALILTITSLRAFSDNCALMAVAQCHYLSVIPQL